MGAHPARAYHGQDGAGLQGAGVVEEQHNAEHNAEQGPEEQDVHQCLPAPVRRGEEPREPQLGASLYLRWQRGEGRELGRALDTVPAPPPPPPSPSLVPAPAEPPSPFQALSILSSTAVKKHITLNKK